MGDFVKASRASQEIRTRAHQQQLLRSEEAISHAKLALVELGKMGVEVARSPRGPSTVPIDAARSLHYAEVYRLADETERNAGKIKSTAHSILYGLSDANSLWQTLKQAGVPVDAHRERIRLVQAAYQALDFDGAKDGLDVLMALLKSEQASAETRRLLSEASLLREDGLRLSVAGRAVRSPHRPPPELLSRRAGRPRGCRSEGGPHGAGPAAPTCPLGEHPDARAGPRGRPIGRHRHRPRWSRCPRRGPPSPRALGPRRVAERRDVARGPSSSRPGDSSSTPNGGEACHGRVNQAELVHVGAENARDRLAAVEAASPRRDYAHAIEPVIDPRARDRQLTYQHVSKTLAGFQGGPRPLAPGGDRHRPRREPPHAGADRPSRRVALSMPCSSPVAARPSSSGSSSSFGSPQAGPADHGAKGLGCPAGRRPWPPAGGKASGGSGRGP